MFGEGLRRQRRTRVVLGALAAAMAAAVVLSAAGIVTAGRQDVDLAAVEGEVLGGHPHTAQALAAQRANDRRRARRCATAAGLAADPARCPAPPRRLARAAKRLTAAGAPAGTQAALEGASASEPLDAAAALSADVGSWSPPIDLNGNFVAQHAVVLPTNKVLLLGPGPPVASNISRAVVYDPATGAKTPVDPPIDPRTNQPYNLWCAGHVLLENGTVFFAGGNDDPQAPGSVKFQGLPRAFTFNPYNLTWTEQPQLYTGRWYPTLTRLADGRVVILGGYDDEGTTNTYALDLEVFTPHPTNRDGVGTISRHDDGSPVPGLYSQMALLPDGNVLRVGPNRPDPQVLQTGSFTWGANLPDTDRRYWGAFTITIEGDQRLLRRIGGAGPTGNGEIATQAATGVFDLDNPSAAEQAGPPLGTPRAHLNAVILPTGEILAVGGGLGQDANSSNYEGPVFQSELFSPAANSWRPVASQTRQRTYHSIALLLADGRVLSAGDDKPAVPPLNIGSRGDDTLELYVPPHLSTGAPRPLIDSLQREIDHGQPFTAQSAQAGSITRAVLISPGAVTHATDMNQRSISLPLTVQGTTLTMTPPSDPDLAPPGHYLLYLVDAGGVPTPGRWVALGTEMGPIVPNDGGNPSLAPPPASPPTGGGTPAGSLRCLGRRATIVGTARGEVLRGTPRADVIVARGGRDTIVGRGGGDAICSGPGNDRVIAGTGNDRSDGGAGADRLVGGAGADLLRGGLGRDLLAGGPGRNVLIGGAGRDRCSGGRASSLRTTCEVKRILP